MSQEVADKRVAAGAKLLDKKIPSWAKRGKNGIKIQSLNMSSDCMCVLGQLARKPLALDEVGVEKASERGQRMLSVGRYGDMALALQRGPYQGARGYFTGAFVTNNGFTVGCTPGSHETTWEELRTAWVREIRARRVKPGSQKYVDA